MQPKRITFLIRRTSQGPLGGSIPCACESTVRSCPIKVKKSVAGRNESVESALGPNSSTDRVEGGAPRFGKGSCDFRQRRPPVAPALHVVHGEANRGN